MSPMTVYVGNRYRTLQIRGLDDQEHDTVEALLIGGPRDRQGSSQARNETRASSLEGVTGSFDIPGLGTRPGLLRNKASRFSGLLRSRR